MIRRLTVCLLVLLLVFPTVPVAQETRIYPSRTNLPFLDVNTFIRFPGGVRLTDGASTLTLAGGVLSLPIGAVTAPSLIFGNASYGIWGGTSSQKPTVVFNQGNVLSFTGLEIGIKSDVVLAWSATGDSLAATDTFLGRESAAILQQGVDAAAPVAQTLKGPDGSGTDKAGGDTTSAPGRGTGTALGGNYYIATAPAGAASNSTQNALVNRVAVSPTGVIGFSPQDVAATPVEPTTTLKLFSHNRSVADDGIVTLPAVTTNGWGTVVAGDASVRTQFVVDATGTVTLVNNTASVVANADTDANLCIGTAATQEPLQVKNRLGATRVLNIIFWYD